MWLSWFGFGPCLLANYDTAPYLVFNVIVISYVIEIYVLLFLEQVVLKNSNTGDCKEMCWKIAYGVRNWLDSES